LKTGSSKQSGNDGAGEVLGAKVSFNLNGIKAPFKMGWFSDTMTPDATAATIADVAATATATLTAALLKRKRS